MNEKNVKRMNEEKSNENGCQKVLIIRMIDKKVMKIIDNKSNENDCEK